MMMGGTTKNSGIVMSSRIRLARNLNEYPFPIKMNNAQAGEIINKVRKIISESEMEELKNSLFVHMQDLGDIDKQMLIEKHLISPDLAENKKDSAAIITRDERISIMINEEDHLRIQVIFHGLKLADALKIGNRIDDLIAKKANYAFSSNYGYLTCCPTNIGTGLRASVMMHLPALVMTGYIRNILEVCSKLNMAVRGIYGEHSSALGNVFQVSNQVTLGQTEEEIVTGITNAATQIIEQEAAVRIELYNQNSVTFEDKIWRSFGLLTNARVLSTEESLNLISDVRLGIDMGIIKDINMEKIDQIMLLIQPASLQKFVGRQLTPVERDVKRAELIRKKLFE